VETRTTEERRGAADARRKVAREGGAEGGAEGAAAEELGGGHVMMTAVAVSRARATAGGGSLYCPASKAQCPASKAQCAAEGAEPEREVEREGEGSGRGKGVEGESSAVPRKPRPTRSSEGGVVDAVKDAGWGGGERDMTGGEDRKRRTRRMRSG
jgi:hypothetical protein